MLVRTLGLPVPPISISERIYGGGRWCRANRAIATPGCRCRSAPRSSERAIGCRRDIPLYAAWPSIRPQPHLLEQWPLPDRCRRTKLASAPSLDVHNFLVHDRRQRASLPAPRKQALRTTAGVDNQLYSLSWCSLRLQRRAVSPAAKMFPGTSSHASLSSPRFLAYFGATSFTGCAFRTPDRDADGSILIYPTGGGMCEPRKRNDAFDAALFFACFSLAWDPNSHQQIPSQPSTPGIFCVSLLGGLLTGISRAP